MYVPFPGGLPTRQQLDAVVPDRPAFMRCYDGHTAWVNSAALRIAGIDRDTPDPRDGVIVRDPDTGEATGALKEGAQELVLAPHPEADRRTRPSPRCASRSAAMHAAGITAIQDAMTEVDEVPLWRALRDAGDLQLRTRLALMMRPNQTLDEWAAPPRRVRRGHRRPARRRVAGRRHPQGLRGRGRRGPDRVHARRRTRTTPPPACPSGRRTQLDAFVAEADRRGWQLEIHAIGDGGIRMVLDAYERAAGANPRRERRHRVEHIETITRADIPRFAELGVVASMQPYHADPSPNQIDVWAGNIGKERAGQAWSWASIRKAGGVIALGSDWPVVPYDPMLALNSAVNRQTKEGHPPGGWLPSEKLSLPEALSAYGHGSAYAAFAEDRRGTLTAGAQADLVVLDRDILDHGPSSIIGTGVALTVVGGQVVHRSEELS